MRSAQELPVDPFPGAFANRPPADSCSVGEAPQWFLIPDPEWFGSEPYGPEQFDLDEFGSTEFGHTEFAQMPSPTRMSSPLDAIDFAINDAERARHETNRSMAARLAALAEVLRLARANPGVYLTEVGFRENDAVELAERSAAFDAARRLDVSPDQVRNQAHEGQVLADRLPNLWALFESGIIGYAQASAAVTQQIGLSDEAVARYDRELAAKAPGQTDEAFRRNARTLGHTLLAEPPVLRHARAMTDRRVSVEPADDGMAWLHAFISAPDAIRIKARLDATAKRDITAEKAAATKAGLPLNGCRTRPQARADLLVAWLAGDGTPNAAKVRPMLFVPVLSLLGTDPHPSKCTGACTGNSTSNSNCSCSSSSTSACTSNCSGTGSTLQPAMLQGYGPIDPVTAAQLFSDAPSFRRVGTDPFTGEILNFDRRRYRPTKAQRQLLAVKYGTCATPGCDRLATSSDVDHVAEWARDHGLTNEDNLIPLCAPDHRLKTLTKIRYTRDPDGSVTVTTPTGYHGRNTPAPPLPDNPPF